MWGRRILLLSAALAVLSQSASMAAGARGAARSGTATAARTQPLQPLWLVLSSGGISVSQQARWASPTGLPPGTFYMLVPDPGKIGRAFATNGDLFQTDDTGRHWHQLSAPAQYAAPAGFTYLAVDSDRRLLFAAGRQPIAYDEARRRWRPWGADWPDAELPTLLMIGHDQVLYAVAGGKLLRTASAASRWQDWSRSLPHGHTIGSLAMGPDGATPYLALDDGALYAVDPSGTARALPSISGSPRLWAMTSDPAGDDVYVADDDHLLVWHQTTAAGQTLSGNWTMPISGHRDDPIVSLLHDGDDLIAVTRSGALYRGRRARWQRLQWAPSGRLDAPGGAIVTALSASAWQAAPPQRIVPAQFRQRCLRVGIGVNQSFDVCGPFRDYYVRFFHPILGWPRGVAYVAQGGAVEQVFENVILQWRGGRVILAPLGALTARSRHFKPGAAPCDTVFVGGYCVSDMFYEFWRQISIDSVSIFGPPVSPLVRERSTDGTGHLVDVQYFVNARLEYHPEPQLLQHIQLSSLGIEFGAQHGH
jgi:hypothetical protein